MRKIAMSCIDNKTKKEIILTDCSYNEACMFLEKNFLGNLIRTNTKNNITTLEFEKRTFYYDENRGYLLGE